ncbi:RNA polymerase sigma factor [Aquabacterium sp. OR-4]|uniref:RNA polymerase sigma factor n=1 Tax=Aquabacterium sp. OR-4 TaxID=2978127 RepID=UPI0028C7C535|nr:sigma-70 family RNA polymerase sigma factor [Aquabacterium sp. OR-4]MDT7838788.1 sigma-70 family RNA polymerase sigma factor [Aquabacterium sp. OR-4]
MFDPASELPALDAPAPAAPAGPAAAAGTGTPPRNRLARWLGRLAAAAMPVDDWVLWQRACAGDAPAATALVRQLTPQALGLALQLLRDRADAEDMVQEAFLRLWRSRPDARLGATLATYFNTIVINRCKSLLTQRRELATEPEALTTLADARQAGLDAVADGNSDGATAGPAAASLQAALRALPARQRMALAMWAYADASVPEIAAALDLDTNAAHQLLHRARQALKRSLAPENLR